MKLRCLEHCITACQVFLDGDCVLPKTEIIRIILNDETLTERERTIHYERYDIVAIDESDVDYFFNHTLLIENANG